jgi:hypothetical protein
MLICRFFGLLLVIVPPLVSAQTFSFNATPTEIAKVVLGTERCSASAGVLRNGVMSFHYFENSIEENGKTTQITNRVLADPTKA